MSKKVQVSKMNEIEPVKTMSPIDISTLLSQVVEKGPEAIKMLDGLLELQEKQQSRIALAEFNRAKAKCQAELPPVKKTREVWNKARTAVTYRYATLDDARKVCLPAICENGFADGWKTENKEKGILITYTVRHDLGHEESTSMFCPMEQSQFMNNIQRSGSTITYGKRYTFCDFWGVVIDEDDDGRGASKPQTKPNQQPQQETAKTPQIDQGECDRRAIAYIDKLVKSCTTDIGWDEAKKVLESQAWNKPQYSSYFQTLKDQFDNQESNQESPGEDDLPF